MAVKLLTMLGLCTSSSEARRLIAQGGATIGEEKTHNPFYPEFK